MAAALLRHFVTGPIKTRPAVVDSPSIVSDVWNVFKLPFQAASYLITGDEEEAPADPVGLHGHSLRLLLVLALDNTPLLGNEMDDGDDYFKDALQTCDDSESTHTILPLVVGQHDAERPFLISFASLYTAVCGDVAGGELLHEEEAMLLYLLVSTNQRFDRYVIGTNCTGHTSQTLCH
jgi:hypothetical protein